MDLEQEFVPSGHAAADLRGNDRAITDDPADDELIRHVLGDQFAGAFQRNLVALAHGKRRQLTEFAQAIAKRIEIVAAGDRHQVGAVGEIRLIGAVERGSPTRRVDEQRSGERLADVALGDQVPDVVDRWRDPALQTDGMANPFAFRGVMHLPGFRGVAAERPFRIDVLAGVDGGHDRREMVGHLDADGDQIDVRMLRELDRVGKGQGNAVMLRRGIRRFPGGWCRRRPPRSLATPATPAYGRWMRIPGSA